MKKIYWLRRIFLLTMVFIVGAAVTGVTPTWIKILLALSVSGYLLLGEEFEFERRVGR
ncbi:hypothetical protein ACO0KD_05655 [Enterococcus avium]|nr:MULTISPECIES: hypothetical protein [Enterococcus]MDT2613124.1 hypothetical protein [Enterococcus dongliensis]